MICLDRECKFMPYWKLFLCSEIPNADGNISIS